MRKLVETAVWYLLDTGAVVVAVLVAARGHASWSLAGVAAFAFVTLVAAARAKIFAAAPAFPALAGALLAGLTASAGFYGLDWIAGAGDQPLSFRSLRSYAAGVPTVTDAAILIAPALFLFVAAYIGLKLPTFWKPPTRTIPW